MSKQYDIAEGMLNILNSERFQKTFQFSKTGSVKAPIQTKPITKSASVSVKNDAQVLTYCVETLAKISEIFDQKGLAKSSAMSILTMNTMIKEAQDGYIERQQPSKMPIDDSGTVREKENCLDCNFTAQKPLHEKTEDSHYVDDDEKDGINREIIQMAVLDLLSESSEEPHEVMASIPFYMPKREHSPEEIEEARLITEQIEAARDPVIQEVLHRFHMGRIESETAIAEVKAILAEKYGHMIAGNIDETPSEPSESEELPEEIVASLKQLDALISLGKKDEKEKEEKICKKCDKKVSKCKCKEIAQKEKEHKEKEKEKEKADKEKEKEKAKKDKEKKGSPMSVLEFIQKQAEINKTAKGTLCGKPHAKVKSGDHYPISDESHGRNALARVNQDASKNPSWWSGSESELINAVTRAVHGKYPGIGKDKKD
jgi:hypothetical protein